MQAIFNSLQQIWNNLKPAKTWSWQTLIGLSLFSWLMSLLAPTLYVKDALAAMSWLFLTLGVGWLLGDKKFTIPIVDLTFYPGPWITGVLCVMFIMEGFELPRSAAFILWPLISAGIASASRFIKPGPVFQQPDVDGRQQIAFWLLSNAIISCWFGFHFLLQDWLRDFPSVLAESYPRSTFVVKLGSSFGETSKGVLILEVAATRMEALLEGESWAETERWLLNIDPEIQAIEAEVKQGIAPAEENPLWRLEAQIPPTTSDTSYVVVLQAIWRGPSSLAGGYYLEKPCQVEQAVNPFSTTTTPPGTEVSCDVVSPPIPNTPTPVEASRPQPTLRPFTGNVSTKIRS